MPVGSYLTRPALTKDQLVEQINNDPIVMARYRRVFNNRTQEEIKRQLSKLHLTQLTTDHISEVWFTRPDGEIGFRERRVKKGTYVYANDEGTPILVQVCGNPLHKVLAAPEPLAAPKQTSSIQEFLEDEPLPPRRTAVLNANMFDMSPMRLSVPTTRNIEVVRLPTPSLTRFFTGISPIAPPIIPPIVPPALPPLIPPIIPPLIPRGDTPPLIPEPGLIALSLSALGSGVILRGATFRRRKRALQ
jgi:hypothetical protein